MIRIYRMTDENHCKACGNAIDRERSFWAKQGLCEECGPSLGTVAPSLEVVHAREQIRESDAEEGLRTLKLFDLA